MTKQELKIKGIPSILWGNQSDTLFIAVHGSKSHKADDAIAVLAEEAAEKGYQVLSFDLPQHGERKSEAAPCKVQHCVKDLAAIMDYSKRQWKDISLFACSMGAYFSLLAYKDEALKQCLFLSPVVNMERIINNMMIWFHVSEEKLRAEKEVETPIGQTLYWDYYCYVKDHPIRVWNKPTSILYGSNDDICEFDVVSDFSNQFDCDLTIMENGEHYFHTEEQMEFYRRWLKKHIL